VIDDDNDGDQGDYLTNTVVAFEEFGESQEVLKLFEFKDKVRTSEQLKRNIVIKIEVSRHFSFTSFTLPM
jgi:NADPH:quinone reductase-like Zn-dependent oxidoreductase